MEKAIKRKIIIYGSNFLVPRFISLLKNTLKIPGLDKISDCANPHGALFYGALDIFGGLSARINNTKFTRLSKLAGAGFYGISTVVDIFSVSGGDYFSFANLPFDASMAYQLIKDTAENYKGKDLLNDLKEVADEGKGLVARLR